MSDDNKAIQLKVSYARSKFQHTYIIFLASTGFLLRLENARSSEPTIEAIFQRYRHDTRLCDTLNVTPQHQFKALLFVSVISAMELFLQEVIAAVITSHPKKIGSAQFKLSDILDAESTEELVYHAAEEYSMKLMYKKPLEYLEEMSKTLSINKKRMLPLWPQFIEAKARRDLGMHNGWKCNPTYIRKLEEAGIKSDLRVDDDAFPYDEEYMDSIGMALNNISDAIASALMEKYSVGDKGR